MRLLFLIGEFLPYQSTTGERFSRLLRHFPPGHEITVITGCPRATKPHRRRIQLGENRLEVVYVPRRDFYYPEIKAQPDRPAPQPDQPKPAGRAAAAKRWLKRIFGLEWGRLRRGMVVTDLNWWWARRLRGVIAKLHRRRNFDAAVASFPTLGPCHLVRFLKSTLQLKVLLDVRDPLAVSLWDRSHFPTLGKWLQGRLECRFLRNSDVHTFINAPLRRLWQPTPQTPWHFLPNVFDPAKRRPFEVPGQERGETRILYAGVLSPMQPLGTLAEGFRQFFAKAGRPRVKFVYAGSSTGMMRQVWREAGLSEALAEFHGQLSQAALEELGRSAGAVIQLGATGPFVECLVSSKIFSYIQMGVPVLAILDPRNTELATLVSSTRIGIVVNDATTLQDWLLRINDDPAAMAQAFFQGPNEDALRAYDASHCARKLESLLQNLVVGKS
jgi:glycosyltransferase involved in cell wall biosynthesis